jgi:hypothetical protein
LFAKIRQKLAERAKYALVMLRHCPTIVDSERTTGYLREWRRAFLPFSLLLSSRGFLSLGGRRLLLLGFSLRFGGVSFVLFLSSGCFLIIGGLLLLGFGGVGFDLQTHRGGSGGKGGHAPLLCSLLRHTQTTTLSFRETVCNHSKTQYNYVSRSHR